MRHDSISILVPDSAPAETDLSTHVGAVMGSAEPTAGLLFDAAPETSTTDAAGGLLFSELASRYLANRELVGLKRRR